MYGRTVRLSPTPRSLGTCVAAQGVFIPGGRCDELTTERKVHGRKPRFGTPVWAIYDRRTSLVSEFERHKMPLSSSTQKNPETTTRKTFECVILGSSFISKKILTSFGGFLLSSAKSGPWKNGWQPGPGDATPCSQARSTSALWHVQHDCAADSMPSTSEGKSEHVFYPCYVQLSILSAKRIQQHLCSRKPTQIRNNHKKQPPNDSPSRVPSMECNNLSKCLKRSYLPSRWSRIWAYHHLQHRRLPANDVAARAFVLLLRQHGMDVRVRIALLQLAHFPDEAASPKRRGIFVDVFKELAVVLGTRLCVHRDRFVYCICDLLRVPRVNDDGSVKALRSSGKFGENHDALTGLLACNILV